MSLFLALFLGASAPVYGQETNSKEERRLRLVSIGNQDEVVKVVNAYSMEKAIRAPDLEAKTRHHIQRIVDVLNREIPDMKSLKSFPDFAITDSDSEVDFGMFFPGHLQLPDRYSAILLIPKQAVKMNAGEDVFVGILAHEIAHQLLNHKTRLGQFWDPQIDRKPAPEGTKDKMSRYLYFTKLVGEDFASALGGVAFSGELGLYFKKMLEEMNVVSLRENKTCGSEILKEFESLQEFIVTHRDKWSLRLDLENTQKATALTDRIAKFKKSLKACAHSVKLTRMKLEMWPLLKPDGWKATFAFVIEHLIERKPDFSTENEFDILFEVGAKVQEGMDRLWTQDRLGKVIWRSPEDEADEYAIYILQDLKMDPVRYMATMFLYSSIHPSADDFKVCVKAYGDGKLAPIGSPSEPHHAPCHRVHNMLSAAGIKPKNSK